MKSFNCIKATMLLCLITLVGCHSSGCWYASPDKSKHSDDWFEVDAYDKDGNSCGWVQSDADNIRLWVVAFPGSVDMYYPIGMRSEAVAKLKSVCRP